MWGKRRYRVISHTIHYIHVWHTQGKTLICFFKKNINVVNGVLGGKGRVDRCGRVIREDRCGSNKNE